MALNELITVAQVGCGYWGPNLLRNFSASEGCRVKYVVEKDPARRRFVEQNYHETRAVEELERVLEDGEVGAVVVATPPRSHFEVGRRALEAGKHILVEKPLTMSVREADGLEEVARPRGLRVMVGHTFLYHPAVEYLKGLVESGEMGRLYFIYTQRLNLGVVRPDVNAMWNLAPHDVSILCHLLGQWPEVVEARGQAYLQAGVEDVVFMRMGFAGGVEGHAHVSWLDPHKTRRVTVVGERRMVVYDDTAEDKVRVYELAELPGKGERPFDRVAPITPVFRAGSVTAPKLASREPLRVEVEHFLECIRTGREPLTGYRHARGVVEVLERGEESLRVSRR